MEELVAIIEQRNEIISNLDQDRQRCTEQNNTRCFHIHRFLCCEKNECNFGFLIREREEDLILEDMMKNKGEKCTFSLFHTVMCPLLSMSYSPLCL